MNYETLLEVIKKLHHANPFMADALTEVVELHQPYQEFTDRDRLLCSECTAISSRRQHYPCETVKAIVNKLPINITDKVSRFAISRG
jgi:hypothetical protein